ncbi:CehA/McbA family metallohydrolase [Halococcus saccharolyticus]|uniref:PHP domain-containing protein n=1 Tax=Halococcus saccharolyticus DSM 5350 TaxID=1227455 RepID=M0MC70_9EURY|nr:PHP domain-containing protein [Halococcus saccharolyticus]EMA43367.1 PHP domain-containing protein [Halococcus saccharolyticus DSM 5350]
MTETATVAIDPHVHSEGSYDGREPVELLLEHVADLELDGIVVTDHDAIEESLRAAELAPEYGLLGIPGVEVSTSHGHLLAIGVETRPKRGRSLTETVERVRDLGGVAVVPHPFQRSRHGVRKRNLSDCDAIEVYNSMVFTGYRNRRARAFAAAHDYPKVGASDAHTLPNVGRAYTEIRIDLDAASLRSEAIDGEAVVEAMRAGATEIKGKRTPIHRSARQYTKGALRKATYLATSRMPVVPTVPASMGK